MHQRACGTDDDVFFASALVFEQLAPGNSDTIKCAHAVGRWAAIEVDGERDGEFCSWHVVCDDLRCVRTGLERQLRQPIRRVEKRLLHKGSIRCDRQGQVPWVIW